MNIMISIYLIISSHIEAINILLRLLKKSYNLKEIKAINSRFHAMSVRSILNN